MSMFIRNKFSSLCTNNSQSLRQTSSYMDHHHIRKQSLEDNQPNVSLRDKGQRHHYVAATDRRESRDSISLDVMPAMHPDLPIDIAGTLHKKGRRLKTWKQRYFEVQGTNMYYFKNEKGKQTQECMGYIDLTKLYYVGKSQAASFGAAFELQTMGRVHLLAARNESDMNEWITAIKSKMTRDAKTRAKKGSRSDINAVFDIKRDRRATIKLRGNPPSTSNGASSIKTPTIMEDEPSQQETSTITASQSFPEFSTHKIAINDGIAPSPSDYQISKATIPNKTDDKHRKLPQQEQPLAVSPTELHDNVFHVPLVDNVPVHHNGVQQQYETTSPVDVELPPPLLGNPTTSPLEVLPLPLVMEPIPPVVEDMLPPVAPLIHEPAPLPLQDPIPSTLDPLPTSPLEDLPPLLHNLQEPFPTSPLQETLPTSPIEDLPPPLLEPLPTSPIADLPPPLDEAIPTSPLNEPIPTSPFEDILPPPLHELAPLPTSPLEDPLPTSPLHDPLPTSPLEDLLPTSPLGDLLPPTSPLDEPLPTSPFGDILLPQHLAVDTPQFNNGLLDDLPSPDDFHLPSSPNFPSFRSATTSDDPPAVQNLREFLGKDDSSWKVPYDSNLLPPMLEPWLKEDNSIDQLRSFLDVCT